MYFKSIKSQFLTQLRSFETTLVNNIEINNNNKNIFFFLYECNFINIQEKRKNDSRYRYLNAKKD